MGAAYGREHDSLGLGHIECVLRQFSTGGTAIPICIHTYRSVYVDRTEEYNTYIDKSSLKDTISLYFVPWNCGKSLTFNLGNLISQLKIKLAPFDIFVFSNFVISFPTLSI
jgi:hypothetical protein